jgi:site-specific recombinase XerD
MKTETIRKKDLTGKKKSGNILWVEIKAYIARHSFSTVLKRSGVSAEFISESLSQSDLKTTENYLDSFEDDIKREYANLLTAFKKKS